MAHLWAVVPVLVLTFHQILAQSFTDYPQCAQLIAFSKIKSLSCHITDIECICKDHSLIDSLLPKVEDNCNLEDFQKTVNVTEGICGKAGVTITVPTSAPTGTKCPPTLSVTIPTVPTATLKVPISIPTVPPLSTPTRLPPTPTTISTGEPRVIPTFTIFSKNASHTSSIAPFQNSTSGKPTATPNATVNPTPKPSPFTGAANRNSAAYIWAATFLGTTVLLLV